MSRIEDETINNNSRKVCAFYFIFFIRFIYDGSLCEYPSINNIDSAFELLYVIEASVVCEDSAGFVIAYHSRFWLYV